MGPSPVRRTVAPQHVCTLDGTVLENGGEGTALGSLALYGNEVSYDGG